MASKVNVAKSLYWADQVARRIMKERGDKKIYTLAAGITPSGTVHVGNFREVITVDIVARALRDAGKKVRFIYSWDDYDRLRKLPENIPMKGYLKERMLMPIVDVPDPFKCHSSYAEHFEKRFEESLSLVGIFPEFIRQSEMYRKCAYAREVKLALKKRETIKEILNKFRKEKLKDYWPLRIYCERCGKESGRVVSWDGDYNVRYECTCGFKGSVDVRKKGNVKLPWRVDWPMRWSYEHVDFEPGGKDHSTPGGSYDTAREIAIAVYNYPPPVYLMYDFVTVKGGGKMSSSLGNVIELGDLLNVYLPEIVRFIFAGTKPKKEISIGLDESVMKVYEDFYRVERIYFSKEEVSEKERVQAIRIYEMSVVEEPGEKMPVQPSFRHAVNIMNVYGDVESAVGYVKNVEGIHRKGDVERYRNVLSRAKFWLERYASDKYKFRLREAVDKTLVNGLGSKEREAICDFIERLRRAESEEEISNAIFKTCDSCALEPKLFFKRMYSILIGKEHGPRLARFILMVGKEKVLELLEKYKRGDCKN